MVVTGKKGCDSRFVGVNYMTDKENREIGRLMKEKRECRNPAIEEKIQEKINFIVLIINKRSRGEETVCLKCGSYDLMEYEDIGEGKFCEKCFNEEMEIWKVESGFYNEEENKTKSSVISCLLVNSLLVVMLSLSDYGFGGLV